MEPPSALRLAPTARVRLGTSATWRGRTRPGIRRLPGHRHE